MTRPTTLSECSKIGENKFYHATNRRLARGAEMALALAGIVLIFGAWAWLAHFQPPRRDFIVDAGGCRTPVTVVEPSAMARGMRSQRAEYAAILLHGLAANRRVMQSIADTLARDGVRAYLVDLPGHGTSTEAYSFARAETCVRAAVRALAAQEQISLSRTMVIGHSMGGSIAMRLADRVPLAATAAISPAPLVLPRRWPANLIVFSAQFDLPQLRQAADKISETAGGQRRHATDFAQGRAFALVHLSAATHSSMLFDPRVLDSIRNWAHWSFSLASPGHPRAEDGKTSDPTRGQPGFQGRILAALLGCAGLLLIFPAVATQFARLGGAVQERRSTEATAAPPRRRKNHQSTQTDPRAGTSHRIVLHWIVAALFSVGLLRFWVPFSFLHQMSADYIGSLLLLAGTVLLALNWTRARAHLHFEMRPVLAAAALGVVCFLAAEFWLKWQLAELWLDWPRLLRFVILAPACWIYFFAEETTLRCGARGGLQRFFCSQFVRFILWLACVVALLAFGSREILIFLMGLYLAGASLLQRLGSDAVGRRSGSLPAAVTFGAILAAWFIAAVFPLS